MLSLVHGLLDWLKSFFFGKEMEVTIVGLAASGKTTFLDLVSTGLFYEDATSTIGYNSETVMRGKITIHIWDVGGRQPFWYMWERYCRDVDVIVYMVDAADSATIELSRNELHALLDKPRLVGVPVLVLGNKSDLPNAMAPRELAEKMNLAAILDREIRCFSISCQEKVNIESALDWLVSYAKFTTR